MTQPNWEEEFREYFDKTLKPKKPTIKYLDRELCINFIQKSIQQAREEVVKEILEMKQESHNEQEVITVDMLNDIVYLGEVPMNAPRAVRNLIFVKVYDIVKYAVKNNLSLTPNTEIQ